MNPTAPLDSTPRCYSLIVFTNRLKDLREFYVGLLGLVIVKEVKDDYFEIDLAGTLLIFRQSRHGETMSNFHLCIVMKNRDAVLVEVKRRGIIVTTLGPYTNLRDPEGRVVKLSLDLVRLDNLPETV
jgi:hypothetical protein